MHVDSVRLRTVSLLEESWVNLEPGDTPAAASPNAALADQEANLAELKRRLSAKRDETPRDRLAKACKREPNLRGRGLS